MADFELLAPGGHQELVDEVLDRLDTKADYDGYYAQLTAGAADSLTGRGDGVSASYLYRTTGGDADVADGTATVKSIHGRTVRWNQLCKVNARTVTSKGVTYTADASGKISLVGTATDSETFQLNTNEAQKPVITAGHKYAILGGSVDVGAFVNVLSVAAPAVFTANVSGAQIIICSVQSTFSQSTAYEFYPQLFDLTLMFGAGNEPSTVAEFEALYPLPYYEYNAGSLLSVQMEGIESADADGNVLTSRTIPATTYFPNGMRSAGTVHDELTADAAVTRVGAVDLGTLTWSWYSDLSVFLSNKLTDRLLGASAAGVCATYGDAFVMSSSTEISGAPDKTLIFSLSNINIFVKDSTYGTDAAAFKAAMSGVMLHYALATPTTQAIDPPLNLTYKAAAGGTERITHTDPTAAPTLVVTYGSTADGIRDRALSAIAPVENGRASANYGVGTYLVHGGQLCRVTTAIATGEAITIGTNVTATTVMAELLTLTQ